MNEEFVKKVRSAAIAGWWTLLIVWIFMVAQWIAYLNFMCRKPDWLLKFWGGGDLQWSTVQNIWLWMTVAFKMSVWIAAMVVIWLSLWARRLRKANT